MKKIYWKPQIQTVEILDRSHLLQNSTKSMSTNDGEVVDKHEDLLSKEFNLWEEDLETNSNGLEDDFDDFEEN